MEKSSYILSKAEPAWYILNIKSAVHLKMSCQSKHMLSQYVSQGPIKSIKSGHDLINLVYIQYTSVYV